MKKHNPQQLTVFNDFRKKLQSEIKEARESKDKTLLALLYSSYQRLTKRSISTKIQILPSSPLQ